jgi:acyl carrier protein
VTIVSEPESHEVRQMVYAFFAEECGVPGDSLRDDLRIIEDLDGDSLMLLSLLGSVCRRYGIKVELRTLGRHLMRKPAGTVGQVVTLTEALARHGDKILEVEL